MVDAHNCTGAEQTRSSGGLFAMSSSTQPGTPPGIIQIITLAGAIGSLFLCFSLLVLAIVLLLRRRRTQGEASSSDKVRDKERPVRPQVVLDPVPPYNRKTHPKSSKRHAGKRDLTIQPYPLLSAPSVTSSSQSQSKTRSTSRDSLQLSRSQVGHNSQRVDDLVGRGGPGAYERRSSVGAVVALERGDRSSPDLRSIQARPSSSAYVDERMLQKMEEMIRPHPSERGGSSAYR